VVATVSKRSTVNEPRMATPPIATGSAAAARLPKITSSRISSTGIENSSALAMLAVTSELIAASIGTVPPTWAVTPL
jgi:hypothetical protein